MIYNAKMFENGKFFGARVNVPLKILGWVCWLVALTWAAAGLTFFPKLDSRIGLTLVVAVVSACMLAAYRYRNRQILFYGISLFDLAVLLALLCVRPSADRMWADGMQRRLGLHVVDGVAEFTNVRNYSYVSTSDFTPDWITRRVPLDRLEKVWLGVEQISEWEGVAHVFISFEYKNEAGNTETLAVSVEIHREVNEEFSVLRGIYRNYEIKYVVGTERDLVGLRTHIRLDPVRMYPLAIGRDNIRRLFLDVMQRAVDLQQHPEFYHTVTNSCASNMLQHFNKFAAVPISKWDKRVIFSGFVDEIVYASNLVPDVGSLNEMRSKYLVDISGFEIDDAYSEHLRAKGLKNATAAKGE